MGNSPFRLEICPLKFYFFEKCLFIFELYPRYMNFGPRIFRAGLSARKIIFFIAESNHPHSDFHFTMGRNSVLPYIRNVHGGAVAVGFGKDCRGNGRFWKKSSRQRRGSGSILFRGHWKIA